MDDYVQIARQFGLFLRRADRFYAETKADTKFGGLELERAAYFLLGRIVADGPARLSVLADDVCLDLSTVSRQVAALEAAHLVQRAPDTADRRASVITATDLGSEVFLRNRENWLAALRDLLSDWSPTERSEFARLFTRLNDTIAAHHPATRETP
ncbi:MAG TPA: MarR family winged helix-turn-helix transcriptional regulator [Micromonosporaceae bacterium]